MKMSKRSTRAIYGARAKPPASAATKTTGMTESCSELDHGELEGSVTRSKKATAFSPAGAPTRDYSAGSEKLAESPRGLNGLNQIVERHPGAENILLVSLSDFEHRLPHHTNTLTIPPFPRTLQPDAARSRTRTWSVTHVTVKHTRPKPGSRRSGRLTSCRQSKSDSFGSVFFASQPTRRTAPNRDTGSEFRQRHQPKRLVIPARSNRGMMIRFRKERRRERHAAAW